ncbi:unnamed protein product [Rotaria magnacalcarata]|uniref:Uncharacterized protein n=2 Tax=Rotaria magnacalcarata TaxID=392030 RepID=A0A819JNQ7_9BILA|nr:unnamed protein product [Rotaria magnacalcarata]CAF1310076.1 unnamed protein product [Rotaria magnacalcarata]CAF2015210.1 unnamed protein product [Rotaria magnacalcarata]CAF3932190.1 unnamed protein product [Rotaria magnacalcarata]CAF5044462.1 unnamed protein product [Rotaria magnacalcarata]
MRSSLFVVGILTLLVVQRVESIYYVYTYDDGVGDDENCCLVRLGDDFCLAKPLTQSLLQVNKECQRLSVDQNNKHYLNKIVRRLPVETSHKVGDKILLELKTPLDTALLKNDLVCLSPNTNNINVEQCFVEIVQDAHKKKKQKVQKEANDTAEQVVVEETNNDIDESGPSLLNINEPIVIREGHGLAFHDVYDLNLTDFRPTSGKQRECWSWYRSHTKELCSHPRKFDKTCISLTAEREKCIQHLFHKKISEEVQEAYTPNVLTVGSKLYCQDTKKQPKLLGYHRRSEICFRSHTQIFIQHKFTDFVSLSDKNNNQDVLEFMSNSTKLTSEFESDCDDKTTLADVKKSLEKKAEAIIVDDNAPLQQ